MSIFGKIKELKELKESIRSTLQKLITDNKILIGNTYYNRFFLDSDSSDSTGKTKIVYIKNEDGSNDSKNAIGVVNENGAVTVTKDISKYPSIIKNLNIRKDDRFHFRKGCLCRYWDASVFITDNNDESINIAWDAFYDESTVNGHTVNDGVITNCNYMFAQSGLKYLDITGWKLGSVLGFKFCFANSKLKELYTKQNIIFNGFDGTSINFLAMFLNCSELKDIDVSKWKINKPSIMASMFENCSSLSSNRIIGVESFDTALVTDMTRMFAGCTQFTTLDLSKWKVDNVKSFVGLFWNCSNLEYLNVSNWNINGILGGWHDGHRIIDDLLNHTAPTGLFDGCSSLKTIVGLETWRPKIKSLWGMFSRCSSIVSLDLSNWTLDKEPIKYTNSDGEGAAVATVMIRTGDYSYMFNECTNLEKVKLFHTDEINVCDYMFAGCTKLTELDFNEAVFKGNFNNVSLYIELNITTLKAGGFDFSNCADKEGLYEQPYYTPFLMFKKLTNIEASMYNLGGKDSVKTIDISHLVNLNVESLMNLLRALVVKSEECSCILAQTQLDRLSEAGYTNEINSISSSTNWKIGVK